MDSRQSHSKPIHLVLDYDGTLTVKDTMAVLEGLANEHSSMTWEEIVRAYMHDYEEYKNTPFPWKDYGREEYSRWLASRKWVEERSAQRVQDSRFLQGATKDKVRDTAKTAVEQGTVQLRDAWLRLFDWSLVGGASRSISILSVNWSESLIREAILQSAQSLKEYPRRNSLCGYVQHMKISANEIQDLEAPGGSSGRVIRENGRDIRTSDDKLLYLPGRRHGSNEGPFVIYAGDSSTDFDCLCAADLGVWLCDVPEAEYETAFKETFKPFAGRTPPPLATISSIDEAQKDFFYWTPNLSLLADLLERNG